MGRYTYVLSIYQCSCGRMFANLHVQVNWPKLNTPQWAVEAYQDALNRASRDPVLGMLVGSGGSEVRPGSLEEGKKRRE